MSNHYFPQEILIEILIRLPVRSLCRFTIVCKSWHALITSPSFISGHLHHALDSTPNHNQRDTGNKTLLLRGDNSNYCWLLGGENEKLNFPFGGYFRLVGSSNGLLCLATELPDDAEKVILRNVSIRRSFVLPRPTIEPLFTYIPVYGFGKNSRDGEDCKVVRIVYPRLLCDEGFRQVRPTEAEVFSLKTRLWKKIVQPDIRCRIMPLCKSQVVVNGHVHWLAYRRRAHALKNLILVFDLIDEVFSEIMVPDELGRGNRVKLCYNLFEDSLTVVKYTKGTGFMSCCIWKMEEYGITGSWTRTYSFDLVEGMEKVLGVLGDGEFLVAKGNKELVLYDIKTSTIKDIGVSGPSPSFYVDRYMESLLLLRG